MSVEHKISSNSLLEILQERKYSRKFNTKFGSFYERIGCIYSKLIKGEIKDVRFEGILIRYFRIEVLEQFSFSYKTNLERFILRFVIEGKFIQNCKCLKRIVKYQEGDQSLIYRNGAEGDLEIGKGSINVVEIYLSPDFLMKYLPIEIDKFKIFAQNINEKRYSLLGNKIYKSSNKTNSILNDIISCSLCGHLKKMYLEYKCMELLLVQFEQQLNLDKKEYSLKNRYIQKMFDIKKYLLNTLYEEHSLASIAKSFGININILKIGFKEVFNTTVFKFIYDEKMKLAKNILENEDTSINEIAYMLGYNKPQYFSVAFKKKYKLLPSKIRRKDSNYFVDNNKRNIC
ncbi:AraC family transcriptional regulator [Elizabethkingia anophelis]|uniref:AraC family transcriptional regulator n=1 Tax=Elizabethkingia anophelis TaxID=1117645 RepID=UPI000994CF44|nr:AraC family transcriptional regulator [Elizabethkingia anophelis]AQW94706.1 hypothetical protein BBD30_11175 [Elizabethkingia anophelis]MCL1691976.1 AraC family transcriptional regulator [Elizabethkingia anophelis]MDV3509052.1 AraC family transcriptional regulator [Elizabethkingia anophelis]MDV3544281.1 AraC family transcriptional regulator [Elizabethkingia anophelis]MDV4009900.1 AraC family transcriptional regulator [Elizabethkingia anophelis]